jgi:hypothetical protein
MHSPAHRRLSASDGIETIAVSERSARPRTMGDMPPDQLLTSRDEARDSYRLGCELLLRGEPRCAKRALQHSLDGGDELAVGIAALALALHLLGASVDDVLARAERAAGRGVSRRERQHVAIVVLALRGRFSRASALGRDHLAEFADDAIVAHVLAAVCGDRVQPAAVAGSVIPGSTTPRWNHSSNIA